jgi:CO dehydrogenase nickel-insertion accessory protein CooC1
MKNINNFKKETLKVKTLIEKIEKEIEKIEKETTDKMVAEIKGFFESNPEIKEIKPKGLRIGKGDFSISVEKITKPKVFGDGCYCYSYEELPIVDLLKVIACINDFSDCLYK